MKFSMRPLASGSSGDTWIALMPAHFMYCWYSWLSLPLKGGPPSVLTCSGKPWVANILSVGNDCFGFCAGDKFDLWVAGVFINDNDDVLS